MAHPWYHSILSSKKYGGKPQNYLNIHNFLDSTKSTFCSWQHRAILHNSFGVFLCEKIFGVVITNSEGKKIPVRLIAEDHIQQDLGYIPSMQDWLQNLSHEPWMTRNVKKIEKEIRL